MEGFLYAISAILLFVLLVMIGLARLLKADSLEHDTQWLWGDYKSKPKDWKINNKKK